MRSFWQRVPALTGKPVVLVATVAAAGVQGGDGIRNGNGPEEAGVGLASGARGRAR